MWASSKILNATYITAASLQGGRMNHQLCNAVATDHTHTQRQGGSLYQKPKGSRGTHNFLKLWISKRLENHNPIFLSNSLTIYFGHGSFADVEPLDQSLLHVATVAPLFQRVFVQTKVACIYWHAVYTCIHVLATKVSSMQTDLGTAGLHKPSNPRDQGQPRTSMNAKNHALSIFE